MRVFPLILALAAGGTAVPARAAEADPSEHRLKFILNGNAYYGPDSLSFWRADGATGVSFDLLPALEVRTLLHVGKTTFTFDSGMTKDLTLKGVMATSADVSIEGGLTVKLLRRGRFTLAAFGEIEASPAQTELKIGRTAIRTERGDFDVSTYAREHTKAYCSWYRIAAGAGFHVRLGPFVPRLQVGFQRLEAALDVQVDGAAKETIRTLGYDPNGVENRYVFGGNQLVLRPGLEIELPHRFAIDVQGMIAPIGGHLQMSAALGLTWRP
jgi:hypothetical protein